MNSRQLSQRGFLTWLQFDPMHEQQLLEHLPDGCGAYVIADSQMFGRLMGQSDILYIGSATGNNGLRGRVQQYFHPGPTQRTNQRINDLIQSNRWLKLSFAVQQTPEAATTLENQLLGECEQEHGELPPLNRRE